MELVWRCDRRQSVLAALARPGQRIVCDDLRQTAQRLRASAQALLDRPIASSDWRRLAAVADESLDIDAVAHRWFAETERVGLANWCADAERQLEAALPELPEQLEHRLRPIREQWESRGPGVLQRLAQIDEQLAANLAERAIVSLVYPAHGGGGWVASSGHVVLEALLANPDPQLPEVLRLAWLIAQARGPHRAPAEWIEPVLASGEYVELCRADETSVELARRLWLAHQTTAEGALKK